MTRADVRRLSLSMRCVPHRIVLVCLALAGIAFSSPVHAQDPSPLERVEAFDLDTARVGRVTAYFAPADRERAVELATLSEEAASLFDRELAISFDFGVAALAPEHWFSEFPGIPYAIPWTSVPERLLFVPSSLEEGLLVRGLSTMAERRRVVDFVLLHEYGHLATKEYFYPGSERDYLSVSWFNELLPNVFAYAFVASTDPEWAKAGKEMWRGVIESREPPVVSLDWGFMNDLPPDELARTYAWYQNLLNLRAAELYEEHGLDFLRMARERLAWEEAGGWTTESLLAALEEIAPGFEGWAGDLQNGDYLSRMGDVGDQPATLEVASAAASFDGADYSTGADKIRHGERVARLLGCNSCHAEDYSGVNFGAMIPIVEGLWATNISLTMPDMSDAELERLLREGVHPTREMYLMPSRQSQFLGERDMDALIAYLRTIEPAGEPTPLPPPDFEAAVTSRLPDDYWRTTEEGQPRSYHNAAEEATYFAKNTVPELGEEHAQGRLVVQTVCSSCHGAAMDGVGEPAGDIQGALEYDDAQFERLLRDGVGRDGKAIDIDWGLDHTPAALTDSEIAAAISYTRALARHRMQQAEMPSQDERLRITLVADEAEAVLSILEARSADATPTTAEWEHLFSSEGYRRLKERETAMRVPFTDEEFRSFVLDDELFERRSALRQTLDTWTSADLGAAAHRALAYLPGDVLVQAKVYLVIKPKTNSFVFDLDGDPAIFLYLDPEVSAPKFENTVAHELHHIGLAAACPDEDPELPPGVRTARQWASAFGEGLAMLAAAGGPGIHPHAASEPEERSVWDRDAENIDRDMRRIEAFLLDLAEERLTDEEETRARGFGLIVSDGVPQGPFYTVGWHVAATVERESSRDRLLAALCDPAALLSEYNRVAYAANQRGRNLPLWSERLAEALRDPEAVE